MRGKVGWMRGVRAVSHLCRTLTMPSSRWLPQRVAGVMPAKLKLGSLLQPAHTRTTKAHERTGYPLHQVAWSFASLSSLLAAGRKFTLPPTQSPHAHPSCVVLHCALSICVIRQPAGGQDSLYGKASAAEVALVTELLRYRGNQNKN